jgi:hypothetical protein
MPERWVIVLKMALFGRPGVRFPARQNPPARTRGPAEKILDHAEGAGGNSLAVLKLPERPLGHAGGLGKGTPVPHAEFDAAGDDVVGKPSPVLTSHVPILPEEVRRV